MNAYAELRMPAHYVDMSQKEMEYDGSGLFGKLINSWSSVVGMIGGAAMVVGGIAIAASTGWTIGGCFLGAGIAVGGSYLFINSAKSLVDIWTN